MRVTINKINERIAAYGYEVVKGYGYFYFVPLDTNNHPHLYDSIVMTYRLNDFDIDRWEGELVQKIADSK